MLCAQRVNVSGWDATDCSQLHAFNHSKMPSMIPEAAYLVPKTAFKTKNTVTG